MKLAEISVKNSLAINLISFFVLVLGIVSMFALKRDAFPDVSFDVVTVTTTYPVASPEDVEKLVTIPLEKEIKGVTGIKEMNSSSDEGLSVIGITIDPKTQDKDKVVDDIRRAVDRVTDLPQEVDEPLVVEITTRERPILEISISGPIPELQKRQYAETLEDRLLDINGVSKVGRIGWRDREFWVELHPQKMQEYYVSMTEVIKALRARNVSLPAGELTTSQNEYNVRITGEFRTPQEVEEVIIRSNDAGNHLKVKDVARVVDAMEDETRIAKINGHRTVAMVVVKQETADVLKVAEAIKQIIEEFKATLPPEVTVTLSNDFSYYVQRRLNVIKGNGIFGFFLVVLILFIFMDPIPAIMTALGIPFALFITFAVMNGLGMSLNLITMLGIIIVLGMLVDDGIVICENIYRYIEQGKPIKEAVIQGANEVILPVVGTITTTWAAFIPLMLMTDIIGKFVKSIPIVVIIALAASMVEAFLILPAHMSDFVKPLRRSTTGQPLNHSHKPWLLKLLSWYTRLLTKAIQRRYLVALGVGILFVATILVAKFHMKIVLFTGEGIEQFFIRAEAVKGTPLEKMDELIVPVEQLIESLPKSEIESYRTYLGSIETERGFDPDAKRGSHLGQVTVFLTPMQKRHRTPQQIIESLRPQLEKIQGFEKLYFYKPREGPPTGKPISVAIKGDDFKVLEEIGQKFKLALNQIKGVSDIATSYEFGKKQIKVVVDEEKARKYYLLIDDIAETVRNAFKGGVATTIKPERAEEEIDVLVRFPKEERNQLSAFEKILIPNQFGKLIPLPAVASIQEAEGAYLINHLDGKRVLNVTAEVDNKEATSLSVNQQLQKEMKDAAKGHLGYSIKYGGEFEEQQESQKNLLTSLTIALLLIFIILASLFNSLMEPFIVMLAVPFGVMGVIWAFLLHGRPLSFFAFMGLVGLTGVVVNNSIVLVEFINKLRKDGKEDLPAIIEAAQIRLRPILMTTITTMGGLVSVAYGIGGGDPFLKPMALAILWGLTFSTLLTLLAIPCVYAIFDDLSQKFLHRGLVSSQNS